MKDLKKIARFASHSLRQRLASLMILNGLQLKSKTSLPRTGAIGFFISSSSLRQIIFCTVSYCYKFCYLFRAIEQEKLLTCSFWNLRTFTDCAFAWYNSFDIFSKMNLSNSLTNVKEASWENLCQKT